MADPLQYVQSGFRGGYNASVDPTRIAPNEYPLLINGRNRYDIVETIRQPAQVTQLPLGIYQGLYAANNFAILFVSGKAYYKDYAVDGSSFTRVDPFDLDPAAYTVWAELVPASTLNFKRIPTSTPVNAPISLTSAVSTTPQALIAQDGVSRPQLLLPDGSGRPAHTYQEWTVNDREYVPIARQMLYTGGILYMVAPDQVNILRSVSGRPLDFMVNVTSPIGDKPSPSESDGGALTASHRVGYNPITCLAALNSPDGGFFVSTARDATKVVPDFTSLVWGEPQFDNVPLFATGALNQFSFVDILGDSTFVDFTGVRSFNAVQQYRVEGKNSPFSAKVFNLFKGVTQTNPCVGKFDNFALYAVNTIYGAATLLYDEIAQSWVGLDMPTGIGAIKQFAEIKTATMRKLLFITADNKLYEAQASPTTAPLSLYVGEWCSNDPKIEQSGMVFKCIIVGAVESGTLTMTPYVDRVKQTAKTVPITAMGAEITIPIEVPFGPSMADAVQSATFDIGRINSGWKIGILLQADFECAISHVSLTSEADNQTVAPAEEAKSFSRFSL